MTSQADVPADIEVAQQEIRHLRQALESRSVIDQAKGLVRAWLCCGEEEAFDALTRASQNANVKVRVLAAQVVRLASDCGVDHDAWMEHHLGPRRAAAAPAPRRDATGT
ncbi:MAG TPA: ANTAR domain-containing protein [Mycobacteriales bacterium]|nr:ANTAR domain-containing protein [Mycobacteriales bacterium]